MRPSTVDLLRIRDGEPVDAAVRAAVDANPELRAELTRLTEVRRGLRSLPALSPPPSGWARVAAALEQPPARAPARSYWLLRAGIAACVAVAAVALVARNQAPLSDGRAPPATIVGDSTAPRVGSLLGTPTYASLVAESARLERVLDGLKRRRGVVRVGTAAAVASLEDRIDAIDTRLTFARELGLDDAQFRQLYRQRVELMNALVQVHYADQARHVDYTIDGDVRRFVY